MWLAASCFVFLCFSFFKWNHSGSSHVRARFYVVLFSSFHLDFSMAALHTPSYLLLCSPLSYKCYFPSKTTTSLCLHTLCSHWNSITLVSSVLILYLSFFRFTYSYMLVFTYACLMASSHLGRSWTYDVTSSSFALWSKIKSIGRRGLYPNNKWLGNI